MVTSKLKFEKILIVLFLVSVFILGIIKIEDTDTWTHLSFGRWIWEHKAIPFQEPFILTSPPAPYDNWLFGLIYYIAYLFFNVYGVILLKAVTVTVAFYILMKDSLLPYKNVFVAIIVMTLIVIVARARFSERPDTFLMIFLPFNIYSLNAYLFDRKKYIYAVPVVDMLWANCHSSIPLMFVPFGAFIAGGLLQQYFNRKGMKFSNTPSMSQIKVISVIFIISFLASLISPYFISQYFYGSHVIGSDWWKQEIVELRAPAGVYLTVTYVLIAAVILSFIFNMKCVSLFHLFLVAPFMFLSFSATRFILLLGIVAGPIVSRNLSSFLEAKSLDKLSAKRILLGAATIWLIIYVPFTISKTNPLHELKEFGFGINYSLLPEGALRYMDRNGIFGRVYNLFHWGGYITWRDFPRREAFIDGRGFLDTKLLEKMGLARTRDNVFDELEKKYGFESALVGYPTVKEDIVQPGTDSALSNPGWALVYWDDNCLLYLKRGGKYDSIIQKDEYKLIKPANGMYSIRRLLDDRESRSIVVNEIERNVRETGSSRGYAFLGFVCDEIGLYSRAIDAYSKVKDTALISFQQEAYSGIAYAYDKLGNPDESIEYYKKALAIRNNAAILYEMGRVYVEKGDKNAALRFLNMALKKNKYLTSLYPLLINLYGELGRPEDVTRTKRLYKEMLTVSAAEEHFRKGVQAYMEGRFGTALDEFKKSISSNPLNPSSYSNLGYLYLDMGNIDFAYEYQRKALDIDPNFANAHYGLAIIYKRHGDLEHEKEQLEDYVRLEPAGYYSRKAKKEIESLQGSDVNRSP
jgi:tetratricopeptide (TPR) repeat protein